MKKRISLIGEILVDLISDENLVFTPKPGGSIFNTASTLSKLGVNTSFYSQIGEDFWGKFLVKKAQENKIDYNFIKISKDFKTPLAFAVIDDESNASYDFYKSKFDYSIQDNDFYGTGIFHFGSFFAISEENQKNIARITENSKKQNFLTCYDPNYRKNVNKKLIKNNIAIIFRNV